MKLILENWQNFVNEAPARVGQTDVANVPQGTSGFQTYKATDEETALKQTDLKPFLDYFKNNQKYFGLVTQLSKILNGETIKKLIKTMQSKDRWGQGKDAKDHEEERTQLIQYFKQLEDLARKAGIINEEELSQAAARQIKDFESFKVTLSKAIPKLIDGLGKNNPQSVISNNPTSPYNQIKTAIDTVTRNYLDVSQAINKLKATAKKSKPTPEQIDVATDKAAENAKKSQNPDQQIKKDAKTIADNAGRPDQAEKISKAIEDKVEAASGQEDQDNNDPEVVDPNKEKLEALKGAYINFRDNFYKQSKLRGQAKLVNSLLAALAAFNKEEEAEAFGKRKDRERKVTSEAVEGEVTAKPKDIKNFKASVRSFRRAIRASKDLVGKASEDTQDGKLIGASSRARVVKFATETQKRIKMLNNSINAILKPEEPSRIDEKFSPNVQAQLDKYKQTLDTIEDVYEIIVGTDLDKGGLDDIINNLEKGTKMEYAEIEKGVKKALQLLSTIKGYFPSIVPFEGGKIEATQIVSEYEAAIRKLNLSSSDIQSLNDALEGEQGKVTILNFQDRLIEFSGDIEKIFGIPGLKEQDSADPDAERQADPAAKDDEGEEAEPEGDKERKESVERIKTMYGDNEFFKGLGDLEKEAFYHFIHFYTKAAKIKLTESIEELFKLGDSGENFRKAFELLKKFNPGYARSVAEHLDIDAHRTQFAAVLNPKLKDQIKPLEITTYKLLTKIFQTRMDLKYEKMNLKVKQRFDMSPKAYEGLVKYLITLINQGPKREVPQMPVEEAANKAPQQIDKILKGLPKDVGAIKKWRNFELRGKETKHYKAFMSLWQSDKFSNRDLILFYDLLRSRLGNYKITLKIPEGQINKMIRSDDMIPSEAGSIESDIQQAAEKGVEAVKKNNPDASPDQVSQAATKAATKAVAEKNPTENPDELKPEVEKAVQQAMGAEKQSTADDPKSGSNLDDIKKQYGDKIKKEELTKEDAEEVVKQLNRILENNKLVFNFGAKIINILNFEIDDETDTRVSFKSENRIFDIKDHFDSIRTPTEDEVLLTGYNTSEQEKEVAIKFLKAISSLINELLLREKTSKRARKKAKQKKQRKQRNIAQKAKNKKQVFSMLDGPRIDDIKNALKDLSEGDYRILLRWLKKNIKNPKLADLFNEKSVDEPAVEPATEPAVEPTPEPTEEEQESLYKIEDDEKEKFQSHFNKPDNDKFFQKVVNVYKNIKEKTGGKFHKIDFKGLNNLLGEVEGKKSTLTLQQMMTFKSRIETFFKVVKSDKVKELNKDVIQEMFVIMNDYIQQYQEAYKIVNGKSHPKGLPSEDLPKEPATEPPSELKLFPDIEMNLGDEEPDEETETSDETEEEYQVGMSKLQPSHDFLDDIFQEKYDSSLWIDNKTYKKVAESINIINNYSYRISFGKNALLKKPDGASIKVNPDTSALYISFNTQPYKIGDKESYNFDLGNKKSYNKFLKSMMYDGERYFPSLFTKIKTRLGFEEQIAKALTPLVEQILREKNG